MVVRRGRQTEFLDLLNYHRRAAHESNPGGTKRMRCNRVCIFPDLDGLGRELKQLWKTANEALQSALRAALKRGWTLTLGPSESRPSHAGCAARETRPPPTAAFLRRVSNHVFRTSMNRNGREVRLGADSPDEATPSVREFRRRSPLSPVGCVRVVLRDVCADAVEVGERFRVECVPTHAGRWR